MPRYALTFRYVDVMPMLSLAVIFLWLRLIGVSGRELLGQAALTVSGYLQPRPDPSTEEALRAAFADLDKELAEILSDRTLPGKQDRTFPS